MVTYTLGKIKKMLDSLAVWLKEYQVWLVGGVGSLSHILMRPEVPYWHHGVSILLGLPLTIFYLAPTTAEYFSLTASGEKTVVFVLAFLGRDVAIGLSRLATAFSKDPTSIIPFLKRK